MGIRTPDKSIIPNLALIEQTQALIWHTLECELVTPLYGGGVEAATVDMNMPIRVSSIRGQLRFWWRLLAKNKWKLGDTKAIRQAEFALWGGQGEGDTGGQASQVLIRIHQPAVKLHDLMSWQDAELPYVMFPASNETNPDISHDLLQPEQLEFHLDFTFSHRLEQDQQRQQQIIETLQWWANFGGLGARTRRGMGAVRVRECFDFEQVSQPLTNEEVAQANCRLVTRGNSANAMSQLRIGIQRLADFRQRPNVGRNPGQQQNRPGRSRWPEPDALRRIHKTHHVNHAPEHRAGNIFPRAMFGLPIIYHFVGAREPGDSQLTPLRAQGDRLASPVIIRPYFTGLNHRGERQWAAAALILPYEHIKTMQVSIGGREDYPVWSVETAQHIQPIEDNKGTDPLDAFLNYFANN